MEDEIELDLSKIKIEIMQNSSGKMRAQVGLQIGVIKIIGYRIFEFTSGQYEVYPPQIMNPYKKDYLDIVRITNKEIWQKVKNLIIDEYLNPNRSRKVSEEINPEEVPF